MHGEKDLLLPHHMQAYRATPHSSTGETLNFLSYGREMRLPDNLVFQAPKSEREPLYAEEVTG